MLRMDQVHVIRDKYFNEGRSMRWIARKMGISRASVRKYVLDQSEPRRQESKPRARPVLEKVGAEIEAVVTEWSTRTTEKQRITATRVHRELVEDGHEVGITTVRSYLAEKRRAAQEGFCR